MRDLVEISAIISDNTAKNLKQKSMNSEQLLRIIVLEGGLDGLHDMVDTCSILDVTRLALQGIEEAQITLVQVRRLGRLAGDVHGSGLLGT